LKKNKNTCIPVSYALIGSGFEL